VPAASGWQRRLSLLQCLTVSGVYEGALVGIGACGSDTWPSNFVIHSGANAGIYFAGTNLYVLPHVDITVLC
jgi:hypothetical protein